MYKKIAMVFIMILMIIGFSGCQDYREPSLNIIGSLEGENIIFEHFGGKSIEYKNIKITISVPNNYTDYPYPQYSNYTNHTFNESNFTIIADDGDSSWEKGEEFSLYLGNLTDNYFELMLIDKTSKSLIMRGKLQGGSLIIEKPVK